MSDEKESSVEGGVEPAVVEPSVVEAGGVEPVVVEPSVVEAGAVEPVVVEPVVVEPGAVEPAVVEPEVVEPVAGESVAEDPAPVVPEVVGRRGRIRPGRVAAVAGCVLLAGAVVAGVGYTVVTVRHADRDAGAPVWAFPKDKAAEAKPAAATGLAGMLVPYGNGWERGPDLGEFGSDRQLSGAQATALRKESLADLPRSQRKQLEKEIDKQRVKGMAMRSYVLAAGSTFFTDQPVSVSVVLTQMESKAAVRDISTFQNEFLEALGAFRDGPAIKGHKNAKCFLTPKDDDEDLDLMTCSAYQGEVLVSVNAEAVEPMNTKAVAALLTDQLDRVEEPGEAV